jgi:hypothetical protein
VTAGYGAGDVARQSAPAAPATGLAASFDAGGRPVGADIDMAVKVFLHQQALTSR